MNSTENLITKQMRSDAKQYVHDWLNGCAPKANTLTASICASVTPTYWPLSEAIGQEVYRRYHVNDSKPRTTYKCPRCKGLGEVVPQHPRGTYSPTGPVTCRGCQGTGRLYAEELRAYHRNAQNYPRITKERKCKHLSTSSPSRLATRPKRKR